MKLNGTGTGWPRESEPAVGVRPDAAGWAGVSRSVACTTCMHGQLHAPLAQHSSSQSPAWFAGEVAAMLSSSTGAATPAPWSQALTTCGSAEASTPAASDNPTCIAGIAATAMALPIPFRTRHKARSRRTAMRDMVIAYDSSGRPT